MRSKTRMLYHTEAREELVLHVTGNPELVSRGEMWQKSSSNLHFRNPSSESELRKEESESQLWNENICDPGLGSRGK
jgi:hypothetical protein